MPHTLNWKDRGLIRTFTGTITGDEILDSNLMMHGDQRFDDIKYVINDFSQVESATISEEDLLALKTIDNIAELSKPYLKIAVIVTQEALFGLAQIYRESMLEASYDAEIFSTLDDAREWVKD